MKRFDDTRLWEIINTYDNTPAPALDDALDDFIVEIHEYCREEKDMAERTRSLNFVRGKLVAGLDECATKLKTIRTMLKRAIHFIDSEIDLIKMDLEHPDRFIEFPSDNPPLARWGSTSGNLIEYFTAPQAAGLIQHPSGKPMTFEETIQLLERVFGITIPQFYDRRVKLLARQKNTTFQDEMRRVYLEEAKKKDK